MPKKCLVLYLVGHAVPSKDVRKAFCFPNKAEQFRWEDISPPALADWPWSVKDVEHPRHWDLCEEQVLRKGL